ncbi:MAG: cardiolipin synthase [Bacteroidaceae bacterium]|nr:cardiolipin synthase [Bacteroidaceae bacterium]
MKSRLFCFFFLWLACTWVLRAQTSAERTIADFRRMGIPFYEGNEVRLLVTGEIKFQDMFPEIENAKRFIHMDYFKFQEDSICGVLFEILKRKASEGVKVRIVYDDFGNRCSDLPLTKEFLAGVRASGIEIEAFDKFHFPWINHVFHRDHHKITIIDGSVCYTGGMNVADYYLHGKPKVGEWRDMHVRLHGPIVDGYENIFARMWYVITGEFLHPDEFVGEDRSRDCVLIGLADRIPRISPAMMRKTYCSCIDNAQKLIQIVNPYPCLSNPVRRSLNKALARGVRVQFMVSEKSDGQANADVTGIEMRKLMKRGAEVYYYQGGFHHSKFMMIDSLFCTVGTTNLDARSLKFDYEVNSYIFSPETTAQLQQVFSKDVEERCYLLTPEKWKELFPGKRRIRARLLMSIKGLL